MAIALARIFNTEIISADSRQFYREMCIGTAVPSDAERATVSHHFIHHKSILELYTVGDFEREAIDTLSFLFKTKKTAIIAGGSGLYVDAVVNGLDDFPTVNQDVRSALQAELDEQGIEVLQLELKKLDPQSYSTIDLSNKQRVMRALEVTRSSGIPFSSYRKGKLSNRDFDTIYIGLTADRTLIYSRINDRVDLMVANGLFEEAEQLYPHKHLNALQTVGYKEVFDYLDKNLTKEEAISEIKKNTRRFAKRQLTWYRKNDSVHWFDYQTEADVIAGFIKQKKGL